jgi:hypothetical protein
MSVDGVHARPGDPSDLMRCRNYVTHFACRGYDGVLVVVNYYRACYCEKAETLVHVFTLGH